MKFITLASILFNLFVWFLTFEGSRMSIRLARPSVQAQLKKEEAEKAELASKAEEAKRAADSKQKEQAALAEKQKQEAIVAQADAILSGTGAIVGDLFYRDDSGREYKSNTMISIWKTPPTDIDPNQWMARVVIADQPKLHQFSVFRATPQIQTDGSIKLTLEQADREKLYSSGASRSDITYREIVISMDASKNLSAVIDGKESDHWKTKFANLPLETFTPFVGEWSGDIKQNRNSKFRLDLTREKDLVGTIVQPDTDNPKRFCRSMVRAHLIDAETLMVYVGRRADNSTGYNCNTNFALKLKQRDGQLFGQAMLDNEVEFDKVQFTRKP